MNTSVIGICGFSGSGKTSYSNEVSTYFNNAFILSCDRYYKTLPNHIDSTSYNFDHPDAIDYEQLCIDIKKLKNNESVNLPYYDFKKHERLEKKEYVKLKKNTAIIVEGIFLLAKENLRSCLDAIIYIDANEKLCFKRRLKRDISERGRNEKYVIEQYLEFVKPSQDEFIKPFIKYADIIVDNNNQEFKFTIPEKIKDLL